MRRSRKGERNTLCKYDTHMIVKMTNSAQAFPFCCSLTPDTVHNFLRFSVGLLYTLSVNQKFIVYSLHEHENLEHCSYFTEN